MIRLFVLIILFCYSTVAFAIDKEKFCKIIKKYQDKSFETSNGLKLQQLRRKRKKDLSSLKSKAFEWKGKIADIDSVGSEYAYVSVRICEDTYVKTWNNEFSDMTSKTLIHIDSKMFDQLIEFSEGDEVKCSGTFSSSKEDYFLETSMTEKGSLLEPEFLVKFSSFEKVN